MRQRSEGSWELRVFAGREPLTGRRQYATKTVRGTKREGNGHSPPTRRGLSVPKAQTGVADDVAHLAAPVRSEHEQAERTQDLGTGSALGGQGDPPPRPSVESEEMKRLLVDYSLIGHGQQLALSLFRREREGVEVGSRIEVVGDSVPPRIAEVEAVSPDHNVFEFAFAG